MAATDTAALATFAGDLTQASITAGARVHALVVKTAYDIQATAKRLAPVDTGFLRSSIGVEVSGVRQVSAVIAPTADYAAYVELGTSRAAAQPFMQPAFDKHVPRLQAALATINAGL